MKCRFRNAARASCTTSDCTRWGQITALPAGPLQAQFGMEGKRIWELARGYDDTPLCPRFTKEND